MPQTTIPTTEHHQHFSSIQGELTAVGYRLYYDEPDFISWWKLDDLITTGSGVDSKNSNHMKVSGTVTHVAGNYQTSGLYFDGGTVLHKEWWEGSGLHGPEAPYVDEEGTTYPAFGCQARIKVDSDSFDQERIIMSKWNDEGNNKEWMFGINPSGGLFMSWKRYTGALDAYYTVNTIASGLVLPDTWQSVGFAVVNRVNFESAFLFFVDDELVYEGLGSYFLEYINPSTRWASGTVHIGGCGYGVNPSGLFKGAMEDVRFFNKRSYNLPEWGAYSSGLTPDTHRPAITAGHPHVIAHFPMWPIHSGHVLAYPTQDQYQLHETINDTYIPSSGSSFYYDHDYWASYAPPADAPSIGSGLFYNSEFDSRRYFAMPNESMPNSWKDNVNGFTVGAWIKPPATATKDGSIAGFRYTPIKTGPFQFRHDNTYLGMNTGWAGNKNQTFSNSLLTVYRRTEPGEWVYVMYTVDLNNGMQMMTVSGIQSTDVLDTSGIISFKTSDGDISVSDYFRLFFNYTNTTAYTWEGGMAEFIWMDRALSHAQMSGFYVNSSGLLPLATAYSGLQAGGWTFGLDTNRGSGNLGGYVLVGSPDNKTLAGYTSGSAHPESGFLGGYVQVGTPAEKTLGGFMTGKNHWDGYLGGYLKTKGQQQINLGAYTVGQEVLPVTSEFFSFFNIIGRDKKEFDAQVQLYRALRQEFDAQAIVYTEEQKPGVNILTPNIPLTSGIPPFNVDFDAEASGLDGKHIVLTYWYFTDVPTTSGSVNSSSGTYTTSHTFAASGEFDVVFVAVDNQGLVNSDRVRINTASGLTLPTISLTATPESGTGPLSVAFSGVISSVPTGTSIVEKSINFGDGTHSASTISIYKLYPVVGSYLPTFRVRDSNGYIVTDTTVVGVNN